MENFEFSIELEKDDESFKEEERKTLMKMLREKHEKHREDVIKMEELKDKKFKTEQEKINFLLDQKDITHKAYLNRRIQSAKYQSKHQTEKIKTTINKVDEYLGLKVNMNE